MQAYPHAYFYRRIVAAKLYIDQQYMDAIDIENIASKAGFSRYDFIRQFRRAYGTTPHKYLTKVRLRHAAHLLESSTARVQDVCFAVGYSSISSFSGLFRRTYGVSPKSYQNFQIGRSTAQTNQPLAFIPGCFSAQYNSNR